MTLQIETGIRHFCDLRLAESATSTPLSLEPGDIIFAKTMSNPLSRLIGRLDGWWCHTAIALGGDLVVHSSSTGISSLSIHELVDRYEAGVAVARPNLDAEARQLSANWAEQSLGAEAGYGASDLGIAFSLLWRAFRQPAAVELYDEIYRDEALNPVGDWRARVTSTCSGFAYRAYAEGAASPLEIDPAPGVRLVEGMLYAPDREELVNEAIEQTEHQESLGDEFRLGRIGLRSSAQAVRELLVDEPVPLRIGVTPADVWMSPTHESRWFITGQKAAIEAIQACSEHEEDIQE